MLCCIFQTKYWDLEERVIKTALKLPSDLQPETVSIA